ncbi:MAG: hypothetical protein JXB43_04775 [Dehalococcoidia bacterium]|nr:hypothetical protein [Dehalococcoidia bacterium]
MKSISLLAVAAILLSLGGCATINNAPRHTTDEVITIARSFDNYQCRLQVGEYCGH